MTSYVSSATLNPVHLLKQVHRGMFCVIKVRRNMHNTDVIRANTVSPEWSWQWVIYYISGLRSQSITAIFLVPDITAFTSGNVYSHEWWNMSHEFHNLYVMWTFGSKQYETLLLHMTLWDASYMVSKASRCSKHQRCTWCTGWWPGVGVMLYNW